MTAQAELYDMVESQLRAAGQRDVSETLADLNDRDDEALADEVISAFQLEETNSDLHPECGDASWLYYNTLDRDDVIKAVARFRQNFTIAHTPSAEL